MENPKSEIFFYYGASMKGTFRPKDCLVVTHVGLDDIQCGDIVVFSKSQSPTDNRIVHRVIKIVPNGLITQGDFNSSRDAMAVLDEDIVGRVTYVERNGRRRAVHGGRYGVLRGQILHIWGPFWWRTRRFVFRRLIAPLGRRWYRRLRESGLVARIWRPTITKTYQDTPGGPMVKYRCGDRTIGYWWPERKYLKCYKPYDLIIWSKVFPKDKTRLP